MDGLNPGWKGPTEATGRRETVPGRAWEWPGWLVLTCVVLLLAMWAHDRNRTWRSELGLWTDCVRKSPGKERPQHNLGFAYYELGRLDEARQAFERALGINPRYALSFYNLGLVCYQKKQYDEAIRHYRKASELNPGHAESIYNIGIAYYWKGRPREAARAYEEFLRVRPTYRNGHSSLGLAYLKMNRMKEAVEAFRRELDLHPDNGYTHVYLGEAYGKLKRYPEAAHHYRKALEIPGLQDAEKVKKALNALEGAVRLRVSTS
jgi:tetratricopeptide (TPR) repeat protein